MSDWLSDVTVPQGWTIQRLKHSIESVQVGVWGDEPENTEDDVLCVRVADFDRPRLRVPESVPTVRSVPRSELKKKELKPGDLLLEKSGGTPANPVGFVAYFDGVQGTAISSNFIARMRLKDGQHPRYWLYAHAASYATKLTARSVKQTTGIQNLDQASYFDERFPFPPVNEQRRIADFLDRETAQIDALVAKQEQLIAGLRERRFSAIASETLRGSDPVHVSTDIALPFAALGHGYSVALGKMLDAARNAKSTEQVLPYIRAANIQDDGLHLDDVNSMPFSAAEARTLDLRAGDVLVVEGGAVGTSTVLTYTMPGWSFQKTVNRLRPTGDWDSRFISYVLRTYRDIGVIDVACNKSTIPHLTAEKLRALRVPAPPAGEQRRIADHLDEQTAKIDALIAKAEEFIALARERRAALITEAVTGRIDVTTGKAREGV
jgi:type I restriction enzyme S subunit